MKYYVYISDAKVDMLLEQFDEQNTRKIATSLGFDWKILSAKRTVEFETKVNRSARLETVVSYIQKYGSIGSVDEPDQYIADTVPMVLDVFQDGDGGPSLMYLTGRTDKTVVGLGGSTKFMLGEDRNAKGFPHTASSQVYRILRRELNQGEIDDDDARGGLSSVIFAERAIRGPKEEYEFVAKRLGYSPDCRGMGALLATPLYIAMAS
jgi:hypothetical protein